MDLIDQLGEVIKEGKEMAERAIAQRYIRSEEYGKAESQNTQEFYSRNMLFQGDNLGVMKSLLEEGYGSMFKCIYVDPPFFSGANYDAVVKLGGKSVKHQAYKDKWNEGLYQYLVMLSARLYLIKELLAEDGLFWMHLDWHVVHYVKILMDSIFGMENMVNEIIWQYKSGGSSTRHFSRKHETILLYSKSRKYKFFPLKEKSYNRGLKPYMFKGVKEYKDDIGWHTLVNMKDVWQIDMVGRTSFERTGYATQKPEKLLERIILSSTEEGDLCADFFMGSGTLCSVANRNGRVFVGCDMGALAMESTIKRLGEEDASFQVKIGEGYDGFSFRPRLDIEIMQMGEDNLIEESFMGIRLKVVSVEEPNLLTLVPPKTFEEVSRMLKEGSLDFMQYLACDPIYDGKVFRPAIFKCKREGEWTIDFPTKGRYKIKLCDVFGNRYFWEN